MKIDGLDPLKGGQPLKPASSKEQVTGTSFLDVLNNIASQQSGGEAGTKISGMTGPLPMGGAFFPELLTGVADGSQQEFTQKLDGLLSDLSMYGNALANPAVPLERLGALMKTMFDKKEGLIALAGKITDPELKQIAAEALNLVLNEAGAFQTGYAA